MIRKLKILLHFPVDLLQMFVSYVPGPIGNALRYWFWKGRLKYLGKNVIIDVGVYFQNPKSITIDDNSWIDRGVIVLAGADKSNRPRRVINNSRFPLERGEVHIGKRVHIGPYSIVSGIAGVYISDDCGVSSGTKIYSFSHHYRSNEHPSDRRYRFSSGFPAWSAAVSDHNEHPSDRRYRFSPLVEHDQQYLVEGPVFLDKNVGVALHAIILPGVSISKDSFVAIDSVVSSSFEENSLMAGNPAQRIRARYEDV